MSWFKHRTTCTDTNNSFADRDLFMRFFGGGVGHSSTREACNFFLNDRYPHTQGTQVQSDGEDDMGNVEIANRHKIKIRFQQGEEDIPDDFDSSDQDEEQELASDSESDVSEVFDFGYERAGSDEESEGNQGLSGSDIEHQDDDRRLEDDPIGFGLEESENEGEVHHEEFDDFGFASF